jgi:hypothetical protein
MPRYLIAYDLMKPGQVYDDLIPALQRLGAKQVLLSMWVIESSLSPSEVRDYLKPYLDTNDRLAVSLLTTWATYRTMIERTE